MTTTDYLDASTLLSTSGFQYVNNILQFFPTSEGYVNVVNCPECTTKQSFDYVYNYTDHLGNVRVSYAWDETAQKLKILEETEERGSPNTNKK